MAWKNVLVKANDSRLINFKRTSTNSYKVYRVLADLERQSFRMVDGTTQDLDFETLLDKIVDGEMSLKAVSNALGQLRYSMNLSDEDFANEYGMKPDNDNMIDEEIRQNYKKLFDVVKETKSKSRSKSGKISPSKELLEQIENLLGERPDQETAQKNFIEFVSGKLDDTQQGTDKITMNIRAYEQKNHKLLDYVMEKGSDELKELFSKLGYGEAIEAESDAQEFQSVSPEFALAYLNRIASKTKARRDFLPAPANPSWSKQLLEVLFGKNKSRVTPSIEYFLMNDTIGGDMGRKRSNAEARVMEKFKEDLRVDKEPVGILRTFKEAANNTNKFKEALRADEALVEEYNQMIDAQVYSIPEDIHAILIDEFIEPSEFRKLKDSEFSHLTHQTTAEDLEDAITDEQRAALGRMKNPSKRFYFDLDSDSYEEDKELLKPLFAATIEYQASKLRSNAKSKMESLEVSEFQRPTTKEGRESLGEEIYLELEEALYSDASSSKSSFDELVIMLSELSILMTRDSNIKNAAFLYFASLKYEEENVDELEKELISIINTKYGEIKTTLLEQIKNRVNNVITREGKYDAYPKMRDWILDNRVM